jgi:hypothetical protein
MASTFDRKLLEILIKNGCTWVRNGRHPVYYSPITKINFPVPVNIKSKHTANVVLKQAGLPKAF